jgi:hypothetical protein
MKRKVILRAIPFLLLMLCATAALEAQLINGRYQDVPMIRVYLNGKWGLVNGQGREVVSPKYDSILAFNNGLAAVELNGKWGYIDTSGKEVVPVKYRSVAREYTGGLIPVQLTVKWGYVNKEGKEVLNFDLDEASSFYDGLALVKYRGRSTFMNGSGRMWIKVDQYDKVALAFHDDLLAVASNGKWGFINKGSEVVIPLIYEKVNAFHNGLAAVRMDGKWGFIDTTGRVVIPFQYSELNLVDMPAGEK